MATRYVWDKYNLDLKPTLSYTSQTVLNLSATSQNQLLYYITSSGQCTISGNNVTFSSPNSRTPGYGGEYLPDNIFLILGSTTANISNVYYAFGNCLYVIADYPQMPTFIADKIYKCTIGSSAIKGSLIGPISNTSNVYPSNGISGSYWYTYKGSDNIDPTAINYPSVIKGGDSITLTATAGTGIKYGGTITYTYEVQLNGGSWTSVGDSTALTMSYTVPAGTTTFRARIKAKDNMGFASTTYATGNQVTVINNSAPTISGSDKDLGSFSYQPPYIEYNVNDADKNEVTVNITLDSANVFNGIAPLGMTRFISFADWSSIIKGQHTIKITANDGQGGTAIRTYTFTKNIENTEIVKEKWHRNNGHDVYDLIYLETDSNIVITNNGKNLTDRLTAIQSRIAALKG